MDVKEIGVYDFPKIFFTYYHF